MITRMRIINKKNPATIKYPSAWLFTSSPSQIASEIPKKRMTKMPRKSTENAAKAPAAIPVALSVALMTVSL